MTKKEFKEQIYYQKMTGAGRENDLGAVYFDWQTGSTADNKYFGGYKYCVYARTLNAKKDDLINELYDFITGKIEDTKWWIQLVVAETDLQRFKLPMSGKGLYNLKGNYNGI